jgi:putative BNR repeat neuraminidase
MTFRRQLQADLAWCWWTRPRATRIGDRLYVGGIASDGAVLAAAHDLRSASVERFELARLEPDDHNNPAILAVPGKPLLAFYARHDADDLLRFRLGSQPEDVTAWEPERRLAFAGVTTYAQAHAVGEEIHVFTRVGDTKWGYAWSPDWGRTWSEPVDFISLETDQETYMPTALLPDGRTLRVAIAGHPKNYERRPWHRIGGVVVDLPTGGVSLPSGGEQLADLRTGRGLPLGGGQLEPVCEAGEGRTLNVFDVGRGDVFEIAYSSKAAGDDDTTDARYEIAALRDGSWEVETIAATGAIFGYIHAGFYVGGMAFSEERDGTVFVSREDGGLWHLERWQRNGDGRWASRAVFAPSTERVVRPWPVRNPGAGLEVLALQLERYDGEYMQTVSHLVGGAAPRDA